MFKYLLATISNALLPSGLRRRVLAYKNKRRRRRDARRLKALREKKRAEYGLFGPEELSEHLRSLPLPDDPALFVHTSLNDLYTFSGTAIDVLTALKGLVGPGGTLFMPTYSGNASGPDAEPFDVNNTPAGTGIVNELLRRSPGAVRSLHPRHSIGGVGPLAGDILSGHELCSSADGPDSPFDRLRKRDDAYILMLGVPPKFLSFLHWLEEIEPERFPVRIHTDEIERVPVRDANGTLREVSCRVKADPYLYLRHDPGQVTPRLSPEAMRYWSFRGVSIGLCHMKTLAGELLALRDKGIVHYR